MDETTAIGTFEPTLPPEVMEKVVVGGDLAELNAAQRAEYYTAVCRSLGLNPLTTPFQYLTLNGKLRLYALRDCADQLRRVHGISIYIVSRERIGDIYVVTARAKDRTGREDESTGAVPLGNLKGDALANALMKCETKAKRRVTLSIAGLGWLDETELDTIPAAKPGTPAKWSAAAENVRSSETVTPCPLPPGDGGLWLGHATADGSARDAADHEEVPARADDHGAVRPSTGTLWPDAGRDPQPGRARFPAGICPRGRAARTGRDTSRGPG
jgi:hypothetical protein